MRDLFITEAEHYLTGRRVRVEAENGIITSVKETEGKNAEEEHDYIAPGFIDDQINGFAGIDFSGVRFSSADLYTAAREIWKTGVTSFIPTLVTNSPEIILRNFRSMADACGKNKSLSASIPGFHLEGPYISHVEGYRGCHPAEYIHDPSWDEFMRFREAADGRIIQVTIAPERKGAMEFITKCTREGIIVSLGHTAANTEQITEAVDRGARLSTHLLNGCANMIHRHRNPLWAQLADDRLKTSIIADGHHLLPEEMKVILKAKGPGNLILVSDVIYLSGMAPGKYRFLGADVLLKEDGMLLDIKENCLAGASFPLIHGVENIASLGGYSLAEAIGMASVNVAGILGLDDRGELAAGRRADMLLFTKIGDTIRLKEVWINGIPLLTKI
ncbi:MAG TPA: N-acetylglucosamine-6-phosphate deacetylase [Bacteroidales bacterium]|nr:N-acetylglucosamine-6-phosphate deacetylase [Bacteroidales bacterium]